MIFYSILTKFIGMSQCVSKPYFFFFNVKERERTEGGGKGEGEGKKLTPH